MNRRKTAVLRVAHGRGLFRRGATEEATASPTSAVFAPVGCASAGAYIVPMYVALSIHNWPVVGE